MTMKKRSRNVRRRGTTLLEVTLSGALLTIVTGSAVVASRLAQDAYREETVVAELDELADVALDRIAERLRPANLGAIFPVATPGSFSDWIDFETVPLPGDDSEPESLVLESDPADPDDGIDNDGDGLVDERYLVWYENRNVAGERKRILTKWVAENLAGEIANNLIDDNENGLIDERGLAFEFQERHIVLHLTLEKPGPDGRIMRTTVERSVALRNTTTP